MELVIDFLAIVGVASLCSIAQGFIDNMSKPDIIEDYHLEPYVSNDSIQDLQEETFGEGL